MRLLSTALLVLIFCNAYSQPKVSVVTQHNDLNRTGWNNSEKILNHANVNSTTFGCIGTLSVDDEIYAQPLIVQNMNAGGYSGSVLFTATVNNSVYAFNADDVSEGAPLWHINLNPAGQRAPNIFDLKDDYYGSPCGGNYRDFSGRIGLVGTPVIDTLSHTLYVATKSIDNNGKFYAYLNAIDLSTGMHKTGSPHVITAEVSGIGEGNNNGVVSYDAKYQNQRPALLLYNNTVYVASASHCDWGPYHGWILGFDANTLSLKYTYNTTPDGWAGGIWMAGQGISVGADGNLYAVTGNGTTSADNNNPRGGRSESLLKLSPQLDLLDWFTPSNYEYLDQADLDYGSDGALLVPNTTLTISGSKEGISYVVDYTNMGRYNATNAQVKDTLVFNPEKQGYVHVHGSPVYANLNNGEFVYAWAETFKLRQFAFNRSSGTFENDFKQGFRNLDNGMPGAMLSLSSDDADTSTAIVWACFPFSGNANNQVRPGSIAAYRANDVSTGELWNSDQIKNDAVGNFAKFNSPTIANGKVYVPTFSQALKVYGTGCAAGFTYANGSGLKAEYYNQSTATSGYNALPDVVRLDNTVNFNWGKQSPAPAISADVFKARWKGKLTPLTDGTYTLYVIASDGVRLYINNQLLIDSWTDKQITTHKAQVSLLKANDYDIRLEYYSNTNDATCILQWSEQNVCKQNIPASQLFASTAKCGSNGTGLLAEYFSNTPVAAPFPATADVKQLEPQIDFNWGPGSPPGISNDLFKARFTGFVQSLDAGTYTFYLTGDDGIRLWVNNQLLIDKWIDQGASEYSASINLPECTKNSIRVEFYENGGDAVCKLEWSGPTKEREVIPTSQLFILADSIPAKPDFLIYPNPHHSGNLTIVTNASLTRGGQLMIYNMLGQIVQTNKIDPVLQNGTFTIPVNLARGMYIVQFAAEGKIFRAKLMVQ